jgi:hypothetical protein
MLKVLGHNGAQCRIRVNRARGHPANGPLCVPVTAARERREQVRLGIWPVCSQIAPASEESAFRNHVTARFFESTQRGWSGIVSGRRPIAMVEVPSAADFPS